MGIAEAVERRKAQTTAKKRCKLGHAIQGLGSDDFDAVMYAIDRCREDVDVPQPQRLFSAAWLHGLLNDNGVDVGITVVKDHLSRKCTCDDRE